MKTGLNSMYLEKMTAYMENRSSNQMVGLTIMVPGIIRSRKTNFDF